MNDYILLSAVGLVGLLILAALACFAESARADYVCKVIEKLTRED